MKTYVDAHRVAGDMVKVTGAGFQILYWIFLYPLLAMVVYPIALAIAGYGLITALVFAALGRSTTARSIARNSLRQAKAPCTWLHNLGRFK